MSRQLRDRALLKRPVRFGSSDQTEFEDSDESEEVTDRIIEWDADIAALRDYQLNDFCICKSDVAESVDRGMWVLPSATCFQGTDSVVFDVTIDGRLSYTSCGFLTEKERVNAAREDFGADFSRYPCLEKVIRELGGDVISLRCSINMRLRQATITRGPFATAFINKPSGTCEIRLSNLPERMYFGFASKVGGAAHFSLLYPQPRKWAKKMKKQAAHLHAPTDGVQIETVYL
jgi:hypothetical protein